MGYPVCRTPYQDSVRTRSALSFAVPRTVTAEDMNKVIERAVPRYEGPILRALVFRWMLGGEEIESRWAPSAKS
jgi:hypothetical protein